MKSTFCFAAILFHISSVAFGLSDFRGKSVDIEKAEPKRIVCMMPNIAEVVEQLGKADSLVGITEYTNLTTVPQKAPRVLGPYNQLSAEAIAELKPDLVIANIDGNDQTLVDQLEKLKLYVVAIDTSSVKSTLRSFELIAALLKTPHAPALTNLKKLMRKKTTKAPQNQKRIFLQVGWDPIVSVSNRTFIHELISRAGGQNIFAESKIKYPRPNAEEVIAANPDVIIICDLTRNGNEANQSAAFWRQFKRITAIKNQKLFIVPGDLITKPTLTLGDGLQRIRETLL